MTRNILPIIESVKLVSLKKFVAIALVSNNKTFVIKFLKKILLIFIKYKLLY